MKGADYAVEAKNLTKVYGKTRAVDGLSFVVERGTLVSLLGVNGAGKSTAIKLLSCLVKPTEGDAFCMGHSVVTSPQEVKRLIALSPQETAVAPNLTVTENLELMTGIAGFSKEKRAQKIEEMLQTFGLTSVKGRRAGKLSGGYQRRLSIAMALVSEPQLLFLDEPTLGLDVLARAELWDAIRALKGKITVVLTTHYMEEAEALSDCVHILSEGRLLFSGSVEEVKRRGGSDRFEQAFIHIVKEGT